MPEFTDVFFWNKERGNICGGSDGIDGLTISKELLKEFSAWHFQFESLEFEENPKFSWEKFHKKGLKLGKKLKVELKGKAEIYYEKPIEDPSNKRNEQFLIK